MIENDSLEDTKRVKKHIKEIDKLKAKASSQYEIDKFILAVPINEYRFIKYLSANGYENEKDVVTFNRNYHLNISYAENIDKCEISYEKLKIFSNHDKKRKTVNVVAVLSILSIFEDVMSDLKSRPDDDLDSLDNQVMLEKIMKEALTMNRKDKIIMTEKEKNKKTNSRLEDSEKKKESIKEGFRERKIKISKFVNSEINHLLGIDSWFTTNDNVKRMDDSNITHILDEDDCFLNIKVKANTVSDKDKLCEDILLLLVLLKIVNLRIKKLSYSRLICSLTLILKNMNNFNRIFNNKKDMIQYNIMNGHTLKEISKLTDRDLKFLMDETIDRDRNKSEKSMFDSFFSPVELTQRTYNIFSKVSDLLSMLCNINGEFLNRWQLEKLGN